MALDITSNHKIAIKYSLNDVALWIDGLEVGTDTNALTPIGMNTLNFSQPNGADPFFGNTKALGVWKEALTDAELRSLTYPTPTAPTFDLDFNTIATDFTFTRNSEATFVNAQGLIQSTNEIGAELVTNGDFATDSGWVKQSGWTISGGSANANVGNDVRIYQAGIGLQVGKTYLLKFDVLNYVSGGVDGFLGYTKNDGKIYATSNGSFEVLITLSNVSQDFVRFHSVGTFVGSIDNVSVKEYITETNTPRLDYSTGAEAFLLEPQSVNLTENSNNFSGTTWTKSNITLSNDSAISPEGKSNSTLISANTVLGRHNITRAKGGVVTASLSIFAKAKELRYIQIASANNTQQIANFDVKDGVIGNVGTNFSNVKIEDYGNGWYRCSVVSDNQYNQYIVSLISSLTSSWLEIWSAPNNTDSLYIYGSQLEQANSVGYSGGYATSYIPTSATTVTRNQELCYNATPVINSEEGVLYAEISGFENDNTKRYISLNNGTLNYDVRLYLDVNGYISVLSKVAGTTQVFLQSNSYTQTDFNKVAFKYKENDFALWINGVKVASDTSGITSPANTLNKLDFNGNNLDFFGNTKGLKYYPKALSDVELQDLTTI